MAAAEGVRIPTERLSPEALRNVLEELVTRDGTESSDAETKIAQVRELLRRGEVELWFDPATGSCSVLPVRARER